MSPPATPPGSWAERMTHHVGGMDTVKGIGADTGVSALFAIGGWLTDTVFKDSDEKTKRLINAVFAAPVAGKILVPDLISSWKERNVPDFLMTALTTTIGVLGVSQNDREMMQSAAMLAALFAMAGRLEEGVEGVNIADIEALEKSVPTEVMRRIETAKGISHETVDLEKIMKGDHVVVPHGQMAPVDGHVVEVRVNGKVQPRGAVSMPQMLSGEQSLISIAHGEHLPQGAIASEGAEFVIKAAADAKESTLLRNVQMLKDAEELAPTRAMHSIKKVVNNWYVPAMIAAVGAQFAYTYLKDKKKHDKKAGKIAAKETPDADAEDAVSDNQPADRKDAWASDRSEQYKKAHEEPHSTGKATKRAAELAIKMAPCAIMAGMLVLPFVKNRLASEFGVIVREDAALEKTKNIGTIITDIRGTLTKGVAEFRGLHLWDEAKGAFKPCEKKVEHSLLGFIGKAESTSVHPLARTLRTAAEERKVALGLGKAEKVFNHGGHGVSASLSAGEVIVGNRHVFAECGPKLPKAMRNAAKEFEDMTYFRVQHKKGPVQWGVATFEDELRPGVVDTIKKLRQGGTKVVLATGMEENTAKRIAAKIDTGDIKDNPLILRTNLLHRTENGLAGKDKLVEEFSGDKGVLAAIGDGANDAPFMSLVKEKGGVSFAIGDTGAGSTKEVASMVIRGIHQLPDLMQLSKDVGRALMLNVGAAASWMTFLIGSHAFGHKMKVQHAAIAHEAPTFLLVLASLMQNFKLLKPMSGAVPGR